MPLMRMPYATFSKIDFGNGFDFWNTMPDAPPQVHHVGAAGVDVLAVDQDVAFHARAGDDVVHPVQRAQERALAAAGRADERRDLVGVQADRDVVQHLGGAVIEVEVVDPDLDRGVLALGPRAGERPALGEGAVVTVSATQLTLRAGC